MKILAVYLPKQLINHFSPLALLTGLLTYKVNCSLANKKYFFFSHLLIPKYRISNQQTSERKYGDMQIKEIPTNSLQGFYCLQLMTAITTTPTELSILVNTQPFDARGILYRGMISLCVHQPARNMCLYTTSYSRYIIQRYDISVCTLVCQEHVSLHNKLLQVYYIEV